VSVFLFQAYQSRLDEIVQRYLTEPSGRSWRFLAAGNWVALVVAHMRHLQSADPQDKPKGFVSQHEVSIWVPIWDVRGDRAAWYLPYVFTDSSGAMVAGREVYGYPKALAWFDSRSDDYLEELKVYVQGVRSAGEEYRPMLALQLKHDDVGASEKSFQSLGEALTLHHIQSEGLRPLSVKSDPPRPKLVLTPPGAQPPTVTQPPKRPPRFVPRISTPPSSVDPDMFLRRLTEDAPLIFLKQFRDALHPEKACYQALVEAHIVVEPERGRRLRGIDRLPDLVAREGTWRFTLPKLADLSLGEDLGLIGDPREPDRGMTANVAQALTTRSPVKLAIELGIELWRWHV